MSRINRPISIVRSSLTASRTKGTMGCPMGSILSSPMSMMTSNATWNKEEESQGMASGGQTTHAGVFSRLVSPLNESSNSYGQHGVGQSRGFATVTSLVSSPSLDEERNQLMAMPTTKLVPQIIQKFDIDRQKLKAFSGEPWRVVSAAVIERPPVVTKEPQDWQKDFEALTAETQMDKDKQYPASFWEKRGSETVGGLSSDMQEDDEGSIHHDDDEEEEDELTRFLSTFKPAPRITEDDESGNVRTTNRKLDQRVYLIVKKDREEHQWQFPQGGLEQEDVSLRSTAERELEEECGKGMDIYFPGNAPSGHFMYEMPEEAQKKFNNFGTKVFFFRGQLLGGDVDVDGEEIVDYAWVTRDEMKEYFSKDLYEYVRFMLDD